MSNGNFVDTGACSNLICPDFVSIHCINFEVRNANNSLFVFSGKGLQVRGDVVVPVEYGNIVAQVEFFVVEIGKTFKSVLGRPGLYVLIPSSKLFFQINQGHHRLTILLRKKSN